MSKHANYIINKSLRRGLEERKINVKRVCGGSPWVESTRKSMSWARRASMKSSRLALIANQDQLTRPMTEIPTFSRLFLSLHIDNSKTNFDWNAQASLGRLINELRKQWGLCCPRNQVNCSSSPSALAKHGNDDDAEMRAVENVKRSFSSFFLSHEMEGIDIDAKLWP